MLDGFCFVCDCDRLQALLWMHLLLLIVWFAALIVTGAKTYLPWKGRRGLALSMLTSPNYSLFKQVLA